MIRDVVNTVVNCTVVRAGNSAENQYFRSMYDERDECYLILLCLLPVVRWTRLTGLLIVAPHISPTVRLYFINSLLSSILKNGDQGSRR